MEYRKPMHVPRRFIAKFQNSEVLDQEFSDFWNGSHDQKWEKTKENGTHETTLITTISIKLRKTLSTKKKKQVKKKVRYRSRYVPRK